VSDGKVVGGVVLFLPNGVDQDVIEEHEFFTLHCASCTPHFVVASFHQELFYATWKRVE
jgi:hypothetical protein